MNFNELIKTKRKEKELTQETLAEMIGTTKQTIANWENDRSKPQLTDDEMIDNIAKTLDISKKEIIESITGLNNTSENYNKETINYPFLPDELMNLKLSEKEIEILFAMEYLEENLAFDYSDDHYIRKIYGDYLCQSTSSSSGEYYKHKLTYDDYIKILGSGKNVLSTKEYIDNILKIVNIDILLKIIRKNNLKELNIQNLKEDDLYLILKPFIPAFCKIAYKSNNKILKYFESNKKHSYSNSKELYGKCSDIKTDILIFSDEIEYGGYRGDSYIKRENIVKYMKETFNNYFLPVQLITETDAAEYESKLKIYNEELESWNRKMIEIKKLQDLYDAEKYPDIPKPEEPEMPKEKLCYKLNYKGVLLEKFFVKMQNKEKSNSDFVKNTRIELSPYLNKEVSVFGTLTAIENNGYLFKSLYIDGKIIDHLWVYDIKEDLIIGNTYEIKGTVEIYTKEVEGKDMKNYGIKVNEINKI